MANIDWTRYGIAQGESVSEDAIAALEQRLGYPLPPAYVNLARFCNGASPEISEFRVADFATCISDFFEISTTPDLFTVLWYLRPQAMNLPSQFVPIARDPMGGMILLNYETIPPTVEFLDQATGKIHFVSNSFESFVTNWHE